jgi:4-amino-4-deoxy-L-arabinose transferase-like glycosyltransferase
MNSPPSPLAAVARGLSGRLDRICVFLLLFALVAATMPQVGVTVDEPMGFFVGVKQIVNWLKKVPDQGLLSRELLDRYWPLSTAESQKTVVFFNHPPTARYVGLVGWLLFGWGWSPQTAMRLGAALTFALAGTVVYHWLKAEYDFAAAVYAVAALVGTPRLFAHAHILATDLQVLCWTVVAMYLVWRLRNGFSWPGFAVAVVCLALLILAKVVSIFVLFVLFCWILLTRRWRLLSLLPAAGALAYVLNPAFWFRSPYAVLQSYLLDHLHRNQYLPLLSYYFGRNLYTWHYPLGMIAVTVPVLILLCFALGLRAEPARRELHLFLASPIVVFVLLMMKPGMYQYDGVRLFLVVFPFIAVFAGVGAMRVDRHLRSFVHQPLLVRALRPVFVALLGASTLLASPYYMSYYNELVGGVAGARRLRLESTYWLDALNDDALARINRALPPNASLFMAPFNYTRYYQVTGTLRPDLREAESLDEADYLLLYCRLAIISGRPDLCRYYADEKPLLEATCQGVPLWQLHVVRKEPGADP